MEVALLRAENSKLERGLKAKEAAAQQIESCWEPSAQSRVAASKAELERQLAALVEDTNEWETESSNGSRPRAYQHGPGGESSDVEPAVDQQLHIGSTSSSGSDGSSVFSVESLRPEAMFQPSAIDAMMKPSYIEPTDSKGSVKIRASASLEMSAGEEAIMNAILGI
eukprot:SAG31_NODE_21198_length_555_cov_1.462719_1_plen_167_part_10